MKEEKEKETTEIKEWFSFYTQKGSGNSIITLAPSGIQLFYSHLPSYSVHDILNLPLSHFTNTPIIRIHCHIIDLHPHSPEDFIIHSCRCIQRKHTKTETFCNFCCSPVIHTFRMHFIISDFTSQQLSSETLLITVTHETLLFMKQWFSIQHDDLLTALKEKITAHHHFELFVKPFVNIINQRVSFSL